MEAAFQEGRKPHTCRNVSECVYQSIRSMARYEQIESIKHITFGFYHALSPASSRWILTHSIPLAAQPPFVISLVQAQPSSANPSQLHEWISQKNKIFDQMK